MLILIASVLILIAVLVSLKYPSISLGFFLTAGFIKTVLILYIPFFRVFDYTVLCAVFLLFTMVYVFIRRGANVSKLINKPVICFLLLAVMLLIESLSTSAPIYGWQKSTRHATLGLIAMLAPIIFAADMKDIKELLIMLFVAGAIIAIVTLIAPHSGVVRIAAEQRGSFLEASPLDSAVRIAVAMLIAIYSALMISSTIKSKLIYFAFVPFMLAAIVITGSRGPFFGAVLCILIILFLVRKQISSIWLFVAGFLILISVIGVFYKLSEESTRRIVSTFESQYEAQIAIEPRSGLFSWAFFNAFSKPVFGHGTGSFAMDYYGTDERCYPHNIILELFYENGLIGVFLFILFMFWIYQRWRVAREVAFYFDNKPQAKELVDMTGLLVVFNLLQSMKSSDIDGNRFLFFTCGLVIACCWCMNNKLQELAAYEDNVCVQNNEGYYVQQS